MDSARAPVEKYPRKTFNVAERAFSVCEPSA
jgi:hypothetical protein